MLLAACLHTYKYIIYICVCCQFDWQFSSNPGHKSQIPSIRMRSFNSLVLILLHIKVTNYSDVPRWAAGSQGVIGNVPLPTHVQHCQQAHINMHMSLCVYVYRPLVMQMPTSYRTCILVPCCCGAESYSRTTTQLLDVCCALI